MTSAWEGISDGLLLLEIHDVVVFLVPSTTGTLGYQKSATAQSGNKHRLIF